MYTISYEDLKNNIISAKAENLIINQVLELTTRLDSKCLFFEKFCCSNFQVQLRLDFKAIDSNGSPTLDADFYSISTGKKVNSMNAKPIHHTMANSPGERIYQWVFVGKELNIRVTISWQVGIAEVFKMNDTFSATIIPGEKNGETSFN